MVFGEIPIFLGINTQPTFSHLQGKFIRNTNSTGGKCTQNKILYFNLFEG
jgi:hypothetical protein